MNKTKTDCFPYGTWEEVLTEITETFANAAIGWGHWSLISSMIPNG